MKVTSAESALSFESRLCQDLYDFERGLGDIL